MGIEAPPRAQWIRTILTELSRIATIQAVKMPLPVDGDFAAELAVIRQRTDLAVGYSGDWGMAGAILAGADGFYSALAGMLPRLALALVRAAQAGRVDEVGRIDDSLKPLWETFRAYGGLRVNYVLLDILGLGHAQAPRPILPLGPEARQRVTDAIEPLLVWA